VTAAAMPASSTGASGIGLRSERGPVLLALMLCTALVALDSTIIATAVPSIVAGIGGFAQFPWLFSIYLLAQAVTVPVYGKLNDLFGRKPVILSGIALFGVGSVLCGLAWSMPVLIAFRLVQGLGAGAIQPTSMTIVGDLYSLSERAKVQGYLASVWGMAAVVGPTLGGALSEYASWRWIFYVNVPLCLLATVMLLRSFTEQVDRSRPEIDYRGAATLTVGCAALILGVLEGGQSWPWLSVAGIAVPAAGAALLIAFVMLERRAASPVLPLWVFSRRLLLTSSLVAAGVGAIVLGLTSYVPTYVQDVLGTGPVVAGLALATLTLGWPLAAAQAGRLYLRWGFRACALVGAAPLLLGCLLLLTLGTGSSVAQVGAVCFLIGLGLGLIAAPTLIAAQSSVGWSERGVVTGNNMFCRSAGSALGVAAFGAIANQMLRADHSRIHLDLATRHVYLSVLVVALATVVAVAAMPRRDVPAPASPAGAASDSSAE